MLLSFQDYGRPAGQVKGKCVTVVIPHGKMSRALVIPPETSECRRVCIKYLPVFSSRCRELEVCHRLRWVEIERKDKTSSGKNQNFSGLVHVKLHGALGKDVVFGEEVYHRPVEIPEFAVAQVRVVAQGPLAAGIEIGPAVPLAGEVYPLGSLPMKFR